MRTAEIKFNYRDMDHLDPDPIEFARFVDVVKRYMPTNYRVYVCNFDVLIAGNDVAGWTLDGYVIPRLASGGYTAKEI